MGGRVTAEARGREVAAEEDQTGRSSDAESVRRLVACGDVFPEGVHEAAPKPGGQQEGPGQKNCGPFMYHAAISKIVKGLYVLVWGKDLLIREGSGGLRDGSAVGHGFSEKLR